MKRYRWALIALLVGLVCAVLSLFTIRRRARYVVSAAIVMAVLLATLFAPIASSWFQRGESTEVVGQFNGRAKVWAALLSAPNRFLAVWQAPQWPGPFTR